MGGWDFVDSFIDDLTLKGFPSKFSTSTVLLPWTSHVALHWMGLISAQAECQAAWRFGFGAGWGRGEGSGAAGDWAALTGTMTLSKSLSPSRPVTSSIK